MSFKVTEGLNMESLLEVLAKHVCGEEALKIVLGTQDSISWVVILQSTYYFVICVVWCNIISDPVSSAYVSDRCAEISQSSVPFGKHGLA